MARVSRLPPGAELRAHLLAWRKDFRDLYTAIARGDSIEFGAYAFEELSKAVDQLQSGAAYEFHRYELPDSHPMALRGRPGDWLILDADNVIRES
jgi:hypothetical protein